MVAARATLSAQARWQRVAQDLGYDGPAPMWRALYEARGLSIEDLAARFNVGARTIKLQLREAGLTIRSRGGPNYVKVGPSDLARLRDEIEIHGVTAVAQMHGLSRATLYQRCYYAEGLKPPHARGD